MVSALEVCFVANSLYRRAFLHLTDISLCNAFERLPSLGYRCICTLNSIHIPSQSASSTAARDHSTGNLHCTSLDCSEKGSPRYSCLYT